jgi:hypothetical protein
VDIRRPLPEATGQFEVLPLPGDDGEFMARRRDAPEDASGYYIFLCGARSWAKDGEGNPTYDQQMQLFWLKPQ